VKDATGGCAAASACRTIADLWINTRCAWQCWRLRARAALKHLVVRAASCGSPGPPVPAQVTLANVASVATIADGNARSMPRARNWSVHDRTCRTPEAFFYRRYFGATLLMQGWVSIGASRAPWFLDRVRLPWKPRHIRGFLLLPPPALCECRHCSLASAKGKAPPKRGQRLSLGSSDEAAPTDTQITAVLRPSHVATSGTNSP